MEITHLVRHLLEWRKPTYAGIAAGDVDRTESVHRCSGGRNHLILIGHIGHDGHDVGIRIHLTDLVRSPVDIGRQVDHADLRTVLGIHLRDSLAQACRGSGDDGDFAFEFRLNHDCSFVCLVRFHDGLFFSCLLAVTAVMRRAGSELDLAVQRFDDDLGIPPPDQHHPQPDGHADAKIYGEGNP